MSHDASAQRFGASEIASVSSPQARLTYFPLQLAQHIARGASENKNWKITRARRGARGVILQ
jgi:hypothetical protein